KDWSGIPTFVFRGEEKDPKTVFKEGMQGKGQANDYDLANYVIANSDNTAYVGSSKDEGVAKDFAKDKGYKLNEGGFVYAHHPGRNPVDVNPTLTEMKKTDPKVDNTKYANEQEVCSTGVKGKRVVLGMQTDPEGQYTGQIHLNPKYHKV